MFLNGGAMRGGPLHHNLQGAPLLGVVRTAPRYRFYSVRDEFPALAPAADGGVSVEGELYDLPEEVMRVSLMPTEPAELELGLIELDDGSTVFSMVLRAGHEGSADLSDISGFGGWRAYTEQLSGG
jgi:hypothetical protein